LSGIVPWTAEGPDLDLAYRVTGFSLAAFKGLLPRLEEIDGTLEGAGRIVGPLFDPSIEGALAVNRGRLRLEGLAQGFTEIELRLTGNRESIVLERLEARLGKGVIALSGQAQLSPGQAPRVDAVIELRNVRHEPIQDLLLEGDASLRLRGEMMAPLLIGDVTVARGSYTRSYDWTRLLLVSLQPGTAAPGKEFAWNPRLNVGVHMAGDFWIRNSIVNAEIGALGRLVGTLDAPSFEGRAFARRGVFQVSFGWFDLLRANAFFEEAQPFLPYLILDGESRQGGYLVRVHVTGQPPNIEMEWSSSPPLTEEQIIQLIATGSIERSSAGDQSAMAAWILSQGLRHSAQDALSSALAVDSIELRPVRSEDGIHSEVVTEKKLTDQLSLKQYLNVEHPASSSLGADYRLTDRLLLSGRPAGNIYVIEVIFGSSSDWRGCWRSFFSVWPLGRTVEPCG
jgi:translocation and assembly module TamB